MLSNKYTMKSLIWKANTLASRGGTGFLSAACFVSKKDACGYRLCKDKGNFLDCAGRRGKQ
jgi:hypothetical protein